MATRKRSFRATGDFDSGEAGDVVKDLVEAGVAGRYDDNVVGVGDLCTLGRALRWSEGRDCRKCGRCGNCRLRRRLGLGVRYCGGRKNGGRDEPD